jgi:hypothetical protein
MIQAIRSISYSKEITAGVRSPRSPDGDPALKRFNVKLTRLLLLPRHFKSPCRLSVSVLGAEVGCVMIYEPSCNVKCVYPLHRLSRRNVCDNFELAFGGAPPQGENKEPP